MRSCWSLTALLTVTVILLLGLSQPAQAAYRVVFTPGGAVFGEVVTVGSEEYLQVKVSPLFGKELGGKCELRLDSRTVAILYPPYMALFPLDRPIKPIEVKGRGKGQVLTPFVLGQERWTHTAEAFCISLRNPNKVVAPAVTFDLEEVQESVAPVEPTQVLSCVVIRLWDEQGNPTEGIVLVKSQVGEQRLEVQGETRLDVAAGPVAVQTRVRSGFTPEAPGWTMAKGQKPSVDIQPGQTIIWDLCKVPGGENR